MASNLRLAGHLTNAPMMGSHTYNAENRLTGTSGVTYTYDGDGRRVVKQQGSTTTTYWYDDAGRVLLQRINGTNREYVYLNGKMVVTILMAPLAQYHFRDHLGSLRVYSERDGSQVWRHDYYPGVYPERSRRGFEKTYTNTCPPSHKFTGQERDPETGLDYFIARHYSPGLARFLSVDPVSRVRPNPQAWNRYTYALNGPLVYRDPDGKEYEYAIDRSTKTISITINVHVKGPASSEALARRVSEKVNEKFGGQHQFTDTSGNKWRLGITAHVSTDDSKLAGMTRNRLHVQEGVETRVAPGGREGTADPAKLMEGSVAEHEILHFVGLEDAYIAVPGFANVLSPMPGHEGSIMGDPLNPDARLTQEELELIGQKLLESAPTKTEAQVPKPITKK